MAVPVQESIAATDSGGSVVGSIAAPKPTGLLSGELWLAKGVSDATASADHWAAAPSSPDAFTEIGEIVTSAADCSFFLIRRVADGTEAATVTMSKDPGRSDTEMIGFSARISGINTTTPLDVLGTAADNGAGSDAILAAPSATTTQDDCLGFYVCASSNSDGAPFSVSGTGWSESAERASGSGGAADVSACWGTIDKATAGALGDATVTGSTNARMVAAQFAIAPAAAVGDTTNISSLGLMGVGI